MSATATQPGLAKVDPMVQYLQQQVFNKDPEYQRFYWQSRMHVRKDSTVDYMFTTPATKMNPRVAFERMRWGGQFVFISTNRKETEQYANSFLPQGFILDLPVTMLKKGGFLFGKKYYYFVARKMLIIPPGDFTERFTYQVELEKTSKGIVVAKQIPSLDNMRGRLRKKFPDESDEFIDARAKKLIQTIFPVFLTREAAFLKILQKHLPPEYIGRVPDVVHLEKDEGGFVNKFHLNWLRKATEPMSHIEFALQATDMLQKLHERARVIHLDLRLDNFVITTDGVGFVDYGSAARVGENIGQSPFLKNLFGEIMKTSQIQRMLGQMKSSGLLTSEFITSSHGQVDKAIDLFYLAVQMENPHSNPDIKELVHYDPNSKEAKIISELTSRVLRPKNPKKPRYTSARDVYKSLQEVADHLSGSND